MQFERRQAPVQVLFRVKGPLQPPGTRQPANRGRFGSPSRPEYRARGGAGGPAFRVVGGGAQGVKHTAGPVAGGARAGRGITEGRRAAPTLIARNPKFPKSLYDVEMSMRQVYKNKPVTITPGMSFPDPKAHRSISNPKAPRFEFEFVPSRDDYNFIHNPIAGAEDPSDMTAGGAIRERYIDAVAYCSDSSSDSSDSDSDSDNPDGPIVNVDSVVTDDAVAHRDGGADKAGPALPPPPEVEQLYAHARHKGYRVREGQAWEPEPPPAFEPQPPPPRAPVDPVLVIPRALVREVSTREQRYGSRNGAGASTSSPPEDINGAE